MKFTDRRCTRAFCGGTIIEEDGDFKCLLCSRAQEDSIPKFVLAELNRKQFAKAQKGKISNLRGQPRL